MTVRAVLRRVQSLFERKSLDAALDDEVSAHLDMLAAEHQRRGLMPEEARLAARRDFGGVEQMKETYRDRRGYRWATDVRQDLRYAARTLARNPGFACVAILTLALGIGANTALFSVMDALMLRDLPVDQPDGLVLLAADEGGASPDFFFSHPLYARLRDQADRFSGLAALMGTTRRQMRVAGAAVDADSVKVEGVSGNYFHVLGVGSALGRTLDKADDLPDAQPVAVLSYGFWSRRFGRDPGVIGRTIALDDVQVAIVGVSRPGFSGFEVGADPDLWMPLGGFFGFGQEFPVLLRSRNSEWLRLFGRLRPGVDRATAQAQAGVLFQQELAEMVRDRPRMTPEQREALLASRILLQPGGEGETRLRQQYARPLVVLIAIVGIVLLVACGNVANLLLARNVARQREISIRMALGAGRRRLARQLLTESMLVSAVGGAVGLIIAVWLASALVARLPDRDVTLRVGLDLRMLGFAGVVAIGTGLLFGVVPTWSATSGRLTSALGDQWRSTATRRRHALQNALVVSQVALSVIVLVAGGLFLRTLQNLQRVDLGFERERLSVFSVNVPGKNDPARRATVYRAVVERLETLPGARSASFSLFGMLTNSNRNVRVAVPGYTPPSEESMRAAASIVGPKFFDVSGIRIVEGRSFSDEDAASGRRVAVINQTMASRFFGKQAVGREFTLQEPNGQPGQRFQVIGVSADAKYRNLREVVTPTMYTAFSQETDPPPVRALILMRTTNTGGPAESAIRQAVRDVDAALVVSDVRSMRALVDGTLARERLLAAVAASFGVLALVVAAIGIYGVRSFVVSRRTNEIGIRMALGATRAAVMATMLRQGVVLALAGLAIGIVAAIPLSRYVSAFLFGLTPGDPATFVGASLVFTLVAMLASYVPARRATNVDPTVALRAE
jgi:predicted permease